MYFFYIFLRTWCASFQGNQELFLINWDEDLSTLHPSIHPNCQGPLYSGNVLRAITPKKIAYSVIS